MYDKQSLSHTMWECKYHIIGYRIAVFGFPAQGSSVLLVVQKHRLFQ
jgi:hypothetical protein